MQRIKLVGFIIVVILIVIVFAFGIMAIQKTFNPNSKYTFNVSSQTVIKQVRSLNRLETAQFTIEKVIDAGTKGNPFQDLLFGDRILLIAHGEIIAGFDLAALPDNSVQVDGQSVTLTLPAPQILVTNLNNDQTRVYDRKLGLLTKGNNDLEAQARQVAEQQIKDAACQGGILDEASNNARKQLTALLKSLGFTTVTVVIPSGSC